MTPEKFENRGFRGGEGADKPQVIGKSEAVEKEASDKAQGFLAVRRGLLALVTALVAGDSRAVRLVVVAG